MALLFFDSARKYVNSLSALTGYVTVNNLIAHATDGRDGGPTFKTNSSNGSLTRTLTHTFVAGDTIIIGQHVYLASVTDVYLHAIGSSAFTSLNAGAAGDRYSYVRVVAGAVTFGTLGSVTRATSVLTLNINQHYFVETKITLQTGATGSVQVKVDGIDFIGGTSGVSGTGLVTASTLPAIRLVIGAGGASGSKMDVFYICDGVGSLHNDFLGNVATIKPAINGNSSVQFTPSAGSNYQNVDENPSDGDTTYNSSSTVGDKDLFTHAGGVTGTVLGVQFHYRARKEASGTTGVKGILSSGGVESKTALLVPSTTETGDIKILEADPNTSAAWTASAVNAALVGYENTITA